MIRLFFCATVLSLSIGIQSLTAQPLSLKQCIDYAVQNNLRVQQQALQAQDNEVRVNTAKNSRLPGVQASLGANAYFGRGPSRSGLYVDNTQLSVAAGLNASATLFSGSRIKHEISGTQFDLKAALQDLSSIKEDVSLSVTTFYLQVLFNQEMVRVYERQVILSKELVTKSEMQFAAGKRPESELHESRALLAQDELKLVEAQNTLNLALLDLSQLLNWEQESPLTIQTPNLNDLPAMDSTLLRNPEQTYLYSVDHRPHILSEQLRVESSRARIRIAKSAFYPTVNLSAGYANDYYHSFLNGYVNPDFSTQLRNNGNEFVGLSVNIPIFNRNATRNQLRLARINLQMNELVLTEAQRTLRKAIEQAYTNATAAYKKHAAAEQALQAASTVFQYEEQKQAAGRSTLFDYNDAKTRMERSESELVQSKYDFVFRCKVLDFYAGKPLEAGL